MARSSAHKQVSVYLYIPNIIGKFNDVVRSVIFCYFNDQVFFFAFIESFAANYHFLSIGLIIK